MNRADYQPRTATAPLRRTGTGFNIAQIGYDIPSLIGYLAVRAERAIKACRPNAGEIRLAQWVLTNVIKSAVDEALSDPDTIGENQHFLSMTDRADADYEGRDLYYADEEKAAWTQFASRGQHPDEQPEGNTGSCMRLWCEALELDPEVISEIALGLIDMIADEARANPDRAKPDATIPMIVDIDSVKMLFSDLPLQFRERAKIVRLRSPKITTPDDRQFDFFQTA